MAFERKSTQAYESFFIFSARFDLQLDLLYRFKFASGGGELE